MKQCTEHQGAGLVMVCPECLADSRQDLRFLKAEAGRTKARLADLESALEFYANPDSWKEQESGIGMSPGEAMDYGDRARIALNRLSPGA